MSATTCATVEDRLDAHRPLGQSEGERPSAGIETVNDDVASGSVPMIACHECGTVQRLRALPEGGAARCPRCGATLYRERRESIEHALMLAVAALILFAIANTFPFLTFELEGNADTSTLLTGVRQLYRDGMWPLALLVLLTATVVPLLWLLGTLYVLLPLWLGRLPRGVARVFRATELLRPWAMMEVYLLGVLVAYVKLSDLARLELGVALFAFVGLIVAMIAAEAALEPHEVWRRLGAQASDRLLRRRHGRSLVSCHACDQLALMVPVPARAAAHCPRCGSELHRRKPNSIARTWALVVAATILYVPANLLPVMTVIHFGQGEPNTILSGVKELIQAGMWPVALLVFFASITVPVLKLIGLTFLLITTQRRSRWRLRDRSVIYRIIEQVGRWSMVDIFMISILVALVNLGALATIEPGVGAICFAAVVIITMFASASFDPRLIWDAEESGDAPGQALRA
jgi:paraquat-inducible protein A